MRTPLADVDPELLARFRSEAPNGLVSLALGLIPKFSADTVRLWTPEGTWLGMNEMPEFMRIVEGIEQQELGFMVVSVRVKGDPRDVAPYSYKARVFEYIGTNAHNAAEGVSSTPYLAIARAFVAFHEAALVKQQSVSRGLDE